MSIAGRAIDAQHRHAACERQKQQGQHAPAPGPGQRATEHPGGPRQPERRRCEKKNDQHGRDVGTGIEPYQQPVGHDPRPADPEKKVAGENI